MKKIVIFSSFLLSIGLISGCAPRNLISGAENVRFFTISETLPKSCKYLGEISGRDIHDGSSVFASAEDLKTDDINFLKNEAKRRGRNVVMLKQHQITQTQTDVKIGKGQTQKILIESHNIQGEAFYCP